MSARRGGNRIRGPQSALTDFLAANNISAAQIRDEHDRRRREAEQDAANAGEGSSAQAAAQAVANEEAEAVAAAEEAVENTRKRKRNEKEAIDKIKRAKTKKGKASKKRGPEDGDDDDEYNDLGIYEKAKPLPGQFEHCEICSKRFTVTPYSKEGPEGGLVCTPCGKELAKDAKAEKKAVKKKPAGRRRRQNESNRLDGVAPNKAKSLQQLCIEKVAQYHDDVEELGDLPQALMDRLSQIFSKKRIMRPKTLKLFVRPDLDTIAIHDAAYLEAEDYQSMFAVAPAVRKVVFRNACQFKDDTLEYMMDKCDKINHLHLYAANLVTNDMWHRVFRHYGEQLETLKLTWLDASFDDDVVAELVVNCPNLQRLKLKLCRRLGEGSIKSIAQLEHLQHLSLQVGHNVEPTTVVDLVKSVGPGLQTLSLEHFLDVDDTVLAAIHESCTHLSKFRLSENDTATDAGFAALFTNWKNPSLSFADFNTTRDVDNNNPTGPEGEEAIGLASTGFAALMAHSGSTLITLDIASCRHISLSTFIDIFNGINIFPMLESINLSFCSCVDTRVVAGIFKSCPNLKKLIAFGCFDVQDVVVPRGILLIGVPKAQDEIEQIGVGIDVDEAVGRMVAIAA